MQANLERNKIGKKIGKVDRKQNLYMPIIVLSLMILASSLLFLFMGINKGSMDYALSKRIPRLIAIILTGGCIGFSTIIFQTITDNRILTPNVMGIDSLYVAIQTMLIFAFGSSSAFVSNKKINFLICLVFMILGTSLLYKLIFKKDNANIIFVLLIGMICGTFFRSLSSFMQMVIDPNEYLVLQNKLFASFNNVNVDILFLSIILVLLMIPFVWDYIKYYDVMSLGKDQAINLGVDYDKIMKKSFVIIAILIAISTSLVGPLTFLGILVTNLAYQMINDYRHSIVIPTSILLSLLALIGGQFLVERVFQFNTTIGVIINFVGGLYFIYILLKEERL